MRDRGGRVNSDATREWEEPAIEFLIQHGFSAAHGARPLKRAVERYLLAPLAATILERRS